MLKAVNKPSIESIFPLNTEYQKKGKKRRVLAECQEQQVLEISTNPRTATIPKGNAQFIMNGLKANSALTAKFLVFKFFPGEAAGVRALNAPAFQVEAKATSSGLRRIQLTPSFLVTPTGPLSVPPPPAPRPPSLSEIDSRVEEAFPGTAFLMVISPQHHLPAAAAPARSAARGPRGPETGRRAGSRRASQAQLRKDWIASLHVRKAFGLAWTPAAPHPLHTHPVQGSPLSPFACNSKRSCPPPESQHKVE
nr:uncharacterized protein LOC129532091 [Gorilla gorilla gorilla]